MQTDNIEIPDFIDITGGRPLAPGARVGISGAKNEVLGAMCAAVLTDGPVTLCNVPFITDVLDLAAVLRGVGADVEYAPHEKRMRIHAKRITSNILPDEALKFRASYYVWGALLSRFARTGEWGSLKIRIPGGCSFGGARAIDFHIRLLQNALGARLAETADSLEFVLPSGAAAPGGPVFHTPIFSHGATFHWMLATALGRGPKVFYNASLEPEVPHLLAMLNRMGANFRGRGSLAIMNSGFGGGLLGGGEFSIMPDRIETGFYALLAMALRSRITLGGTNAESCRPWLNSVMEIAKKGCVEISADEMRFDFRALPGFEGRNYVMSPIPGKETDMQQIWTPVLSMAKSPSAIYDPIWPGRTGHIAEMAKFGID
ncbi:MAG: hypothetical protein LBB08_01365, partial [Rickettsiales bacterium]|nr:hypothetical protein [Rickettsiales bacterium]